MDVRLGVGENDLGLEFSVQLVEEFEDRLTITREVASLKILENNLILLYSKDRHGIVMLFHYID